MIRLGFIGLIIFFNSISSYAQKSDSVLTLNAKIAYLSNSQLYITAGTEAGIFTNDTVFVSVQTKAQSAYKVISSSSKTALLQALETPLMVTIGQEIRISFERQNEKKEENKEIEERKSILGTRQKTKVKADEAQISGRYFLGFNGFASRSLWNEHIKEAFYRFSAEPQVGYVLRASNLKGGIEVNLNSRIDYRYYSKSTIDQPLQLRFYDFNVRKEFRKVGILLEAGRFNNDFDSFSGFWDGMLVRFGNQKSGVGIIAGSEPIRSSELTSINQPKLSSFVYHRFSIGAFSSSSEISLTQLNPESGFLHRFLGINQRLRLGKFSINANAQLDQSLESKTWKSSFLSIQARQRFENSTSFYISYVRREPYQIWLSQPFGSVNERIGGGFSMNFTSFHFGNEFNYNQIEAANSAWSYSNWMLWSKLTRFELDYQISTQFWQGYKSFAISSVSQFSKYLASNLIIAGYQFNYSNFYDSISHTHGLFAQYQHTLSKKSQLSARFSIDAGLLLIRTGFYVSYWRTF